MESDFSDLIAHQSKDRPHLAPLISRFSEKWPQVIWCDSGWDEILVRLNKDLSILDPNYQLHQVKEKFGTLRYYTDHACKEVCYRSLKCPFYQRIAQAEQEAHSLCHHCGPKDRCSCGYNLSRTDPENRLDHDHLLKDFEAVTLSQSTFLPSNARSSPFARR